MHTEAQSILVVGGAGFIGSHMVLALQEAGYQPIVLDNLSKGHRDAVDCEFVQGDMADKTLLDAIFKKYPITAVMHFGSFIEVAESVRDPARYYQNNVAATLNLLDVMLAHDIRQFIFSSSAAVYGEPRYTPIDEAHPIAPINPYGRTKWMVEEIIKDYAAANHLQYALLRYFNAAGADPRGRLRERHDPESHLIPLILQVAEGKRDKMVIYGQDYPTPDGTCVRDYVHVSDLCSAHLLALQQCFQGKSGIYNLGTGQGHSVQSVIDTAARITGRPIPLIYSERRPGDPAVLVANAQLATQVLDWKVNYPDIATIIEHAWKALTA